MDVSLAYVELTKDLDGEWLNGIKNAFSDLKKLGFQNVNEPLELSYLE